MAYWYGGRNIERVNKRHLIRLTEYLEKNIASKKKKKKKGDLTIARKDRSDHD